MNGNVQVPVCRACDKHDQQDMKIQMALACCATIALVYLLAPSGARTRYNVLTS